MRRNPGGGILAAQVIETLDEGRVAEQLAAEMERVAVAATRTQKKGKLVLEIELEPEGEAVRLTSRLKSTVPMPTPVGALWYVTEDNRLQRRNPAQMELDLSPLPEESRKIEKWDE